MSAADSRKHYWSHREEKLIESKAAYRRRKPIVLAQQKRRMHEFKTACVNMYSNGDACCAWCRNADMEVLCLDHIDNDGYKQKMGNGYRKYTGLSFYRRLQAQNYPPGMQVLCHNCNIKKHREFLRATREGRPARVGTYIQSEY